MQNNSSNRWLTLLTVVLLCANAVTLFVFWKKDKESTGRHLPPPPREMASGPVFEFIVQSLQFSEEQEKAFSLLRDEHRHIRKPLLTALKNAKDSFYALLPIIPSNDTTLRKASERSAQINQQLDLVNFKHFQDIRKICTLEQAEQFDRIIKELIARMGKGQGALPVEMKSKGDNHHRLPPPQMEDGVPPPPPDADR